VSVVAYWCELCQNERITYWCEFLGKSVGSNGEQKGHSQLMP
jgi:hypothetical protein